MKHIILYENFRDTLKGARDIFGLTSSIDITKNYTIEGPIEYEEEARRIADDIIKKINQYPLAATPQYSVWDSYLDYAFNNWMPDEQAALARIGWEIKN